MNFMKCLCAFVISLVVLSILYYYIHIPILPCCIFYIFMGLISKFNVKSKFSSTFFISLLGIISIFTYGISIYVSISNYPEYLNIIGIILEFITLLSLISAFVMISAIKKD